ncbi:MAG: transposase [Lachnospiraceae bacterium]|nr:transposase [Lachnospiraceae bacterium]
MQQITDETRKKVVCEHIRDGRTIASLAAEYGVSKATISNWVRVYCEECQTNDSEKSQLELMEEVRKLRQEKSELEKENKDKAISMDDLSDFSDELREKVKSFSE